MYFRSILLKHNYQIEECQSQDTKQVETCVIYEMENGASGSDTEASGYESDKYDTDDGHMSDWEDTDLTTWTDSANKGKNYCPKFNFLTFLNRWKTCVS